MVKYSEQQIDNLNKDIKENFPHIYTISNKMKITHEGISRLIMLDRYSQKDRHLKTLAIGDLVITKIKHDTKFPTLGIGNITNIFKNNVEIQIEKEYISQIDKSFKDDNGKIIVSKLLISKPLELFYEQIAKRVGYALVAGDKPEFADKFFHEIANLNFVPAGRVLYGAGSKTNVTFFNCFVMPMIHDSRNGIAIHRKEVMEIMSRGGGVGTNGSTLRPRNAPAITVGGHSSGAVTWLDDLSALTNIVQQGGSRRGAQMIILNDWHPDIIEFIVSKMQKPEILKWISTNFKDKTIRHFAEDKLKFNKYTPNEKKMFKTIIEHSNDSELVNEAKNKLEIGGEYEVEHPEYLSGANISVGITNDFIKAVKRDEVYELKFPDIQNFTQEQKDFYEKEWQNIGDVRAWEELGLPVKVHKKIQARELWDLIVFCATYSAEPGIFFIDRANEMTNATAYNQKVVGTNPCGEQPLTPYAVCNLGAINLSNMVDKEKGEILWDKLRETIQIAVRMQDNVIDKTPYFLEANKVQAFNERRIGMGVMGLHDLLIWLKIRYGSKKSLNVIDKLFHFITTTAYKTSADLGKEKGFFPYMKSLKKLLKTGFISNLPEETREYIKKIGGLRNSHLLTIAPTGSTGTMVGVSTGLEPYFAFKYYRSGRLGKFIKVEQRIVKEYKKIHNLKPEDKLPSHFVTTMDLTPDEHVNIQTTIQRWVDSSLSKTVNAPEGYSVDNVKKIYMKLYDNGAKGGTVYVDASRTAQVLSLTNDDKKTPKHSAPLTSSSNKQIQEVKKQYQDVPGYKHDRKIGTNVGDLCPICKEGTVENLGGCNTCTICGMQLKCGK